MNICGKCGETLNSIKSTIASRLFPIRCAHCDCKNYRNHSIFYYVSTVLFSIGVLVLIFIAMSQGFAFSGKTFIGFIVLLLGIYLAEVYFRPLEVYSAEEKEKDKASSRNKVLVALVVILISVALYLLD